MEGLIVNAMDGCERCLENPRNYDARADLMWTATLALNGLTGAGLGRVGFPMHMVEHSLSALYDVPHGAGLSVVIPGWLKWRMKTDPVKIAQLGRRIFQTDHGSMQEQAVSTITFLTDWFRKVKCPTSLNDLEIAETEISTIAANAMGLATVWRLNEYSREVIEEILHLCR